MGEFNTMSDKLLGLRESDPETSVHRQTAVDVIYELATKPGTVQLDAISCMAWSDESDLPTDGWANLRNIALDIAEDKNRLDDERLQAASMVLLLTDSE